jgi:hypothetical protein
MAPFRKDLLVSLCSLHVVNVWKVALKLEGKDGIVNLFTVIDEFSPQWELFRAISTKNGVKLPEKEDLFPTLRGK